MKKNLLLPSDISNAVCCLVSKNKLWAGKKVVISIIANKTAGCFTHKKKSSKLKALLDNCIQRNSSKETVTQSVESKIYVTQYANHAKELTDAIIAEFAGLENDIHCLLVTAGGDGTCQEVQTALIKAAYSSETNHSNNNKNQYKKFKDSKEPTDIKKITSILERTKFLKVKT